MTTPIDTEDVRARIIEGFKTIYDPEIPINIYDLGLIYDVIVSEEGDVQVNMTLTAPNCPAAQILPAQVELKASATEGVRKAKVDIVWDPPWGKDKMSEEALLALGLL